jgi:hypothetical protein
MDITLGVFADYAFSEFGVELHPKTPAANAHTIRKNEMPKALARLGAGRICTLHVVAPNVLLLTTNAAEAVARGYLRALLPSITKRISSTCFRHRFLTVTPRQLAKLQGIDPGAHARAWEEFTGEAARLALGAPAPEEAEAAAAAALLALDAPAGAASSSRASRSPRAACSPTSTRCSSPRSPRRPSKRSAPSPPPTSMTP